MKILIAEDTEDSRIILKKILEGAGHEVREAPNGAEALKLAKESPPEMIISDILMPEMDGYQFCKEVKSNSTLRKIPFIFYTATYTDPRDERLAISLGASRFILKPMESDKFLLILNQVIQEYKEDKLLVPRMPLKEDTELSERYNESLVRKLDKKILDLEKEIIERRKTESALKTSEDKYRSLIENIPDVIWTTDINGNTTFISKNIQDIYGYTPDEIYQQGDKLWLGRIHPDDVASVKNAFLDLFDKDIPLDVDYRIQKKDGEWIWLQDKSIGTYEKDGVKLADGIFIDITERKRFEEEQQRAAIYFDSIIDSIIVLNQKKEITDVNQEFSRLWGYGPLEVKGKPVSMLFPEEEMPKHLSGINKAITTGKPSKFETLALTKSGKKVPVFMRGSAIFDKSGEPTELIGVFRDITDLKKAEKKYQESEFRYRNMVNSAGDAIISLDTEGNITSWNEEAHKVFGYNPEEVLDRNIGILISDDLKEESEQLLEEVQEIGFIREFETIRIAKDGTGIPVEITLSSLTDEKGSFTGTSEIVRDISKRKKHEALIENIAEGISAITGDEFFNSLVTNLARTLGVDFSFIGLLSTEKEKTVHTLSVYAIDGIADNFEYALADTPCENVIGKTLCSYPSDVYGKFPNDHMLEEMGIESYIGMPLFDMNNMPLGLIVVMDRKPIANENLAKYLLKIFSTRAASEILRQRSEKTLKASENKLRVIFDNAIDGILVADIEQKKFITGNTEICRMLGYSSEEILELGVQDIHPVKDLPYVIDQFKKQFKGEIKTATNIPVKRKNGGIFYADINSSPATFMGKNCLIGIFRDMTERRKIEEALRESENKFKSLYSSMNEGVALHEVIYDDSGHNIDYRILDVNPSYERITGLSKEESVGKIASQLYGTDEPPYLEIYGKVAESGEPANFETYFPPMEKHFQISVISPSKGKFATVFMDITHQIKSLELIKENEEKFRMIFDNSPLGIIHFDESGQVTDCNDIMPDIISAPKEKIIGFNMITSVKDNGMSAAVKDCLTSGRGQFEGNYVTVLGNRSLTLKVDFRSARTSDTGAIGGIGIFEDITEKKKAESVLTETMKQEEAVSVLGQSALEGIALDLLMNEAVNKVTNILNIEYCKVLELLPDKKGLLLKAGVGWQKGLVGRATEASDDSTQAGYSLSTGNPVVIDDMQKETRFTDPPHMFDHGVVGGVCVVIGSIESPYGVLCAHTSKKRSFKKHDIHFMSAVSNVIGSAVTRKEYETLLFQSKQDWEETFNTITDMVTIQDKNFNIILSNNAAEKILRMPDSEVTKQIKCFKIFHGSNCPPKACPSCDCLQTGEPSTFSVFEPYLNMHLEIRAMPRFDEQHNLIGLIHIVRDMTEQKKLEDQLRHAQKMEAVGQLAGGVAHDFNNILTAVIGYGNLLNMKLKKDDPLKHHVEQIIRITERGAGLTHGLLAFSRKQAIDLKPVNINKVLETSINILPRLIRENIELKSELLEENLYIMADSIQIEQIMMNLASNARDSMPDGGYISIKTEIVNINKDYINTHGFGRQGKYVVLSIADTGTGMNNDIKDKVFEPFFSTKKMGEGTGLGLSIVYGIVKQHSGFIIVDSEEGIGTTFRIYFPLINDSKEEEAAAVIEPSRGNELILLAEDEEEVRAPLKVILENYGYEVIEAFDGKDAVEKFKANKDRIKLMIFDVIMPKMNGKAAYDKIKAIKPDISAIFTSGYTEDTLQTQEILNEGLLFISKPVSPNSMLVKIREVLDR